MPERNRSLWKALLPLGLLAVVLAVLRRRGDCWEYGGGRELAPTPGPAPVEARPVTGGRRPAGRFAAAAGFTALFFAGAAFTAGAGDQAARLVEEDASALAEFALSATETKPAAEALAPEPAPAPAPEPAAPAPAPEPAPEPAAEPAVPAAIAAGEPAPESAVPAAAAPRNMTAVAPEAQPAASPAPAPTAKPQPQPSASTKKWIVKRASAPPARAPEIERGREHGYGEPTVWLNRALPDPTPASARLARSFAKQLASASERHGTDWATVLAVLRAQGERSSVPATVQELDTLAKRLAGHDAWRGALAVSGRTAFADRAAALADLYRFVGLESLVTGFAAAKERLTRKLLATEGVLVYAGGRDDVAAGRIDVRIVVLVGYLAERHGSVTVSSLFTGHRKYARPGVVSAHTYGHAVDLAAVGGTPIAGNQRPGGTTEAAVRSVLLLPAELQPQQVISLLGLGGPSFPLADHGDHIHVGY